MFENISTGQTVMLTFAGSTQGLAMRAVYTGELNGVHSLRGMGVMSDARFSAVRTSEGWALTNGRTLHSVKAV